MKLSWIIIIFLIIGAFIIIRANDYKVTESGEAKSFAKDFSKWVFQVGKSTWKTVGYAVKQEWLPKVNETNTTINITE